MRTFDFVVMNPPFSDKSWSNGLENDYGRFEFGRPPQKNGDYAFLLHVLKSLKSTGKAAIILPHGVLFRGHAEADIRRQLLTRGYIKGIIGLPPNLFYGTGIPACIVVLDKENATGRTGVFMIDASKGFMKDGNKNRLRAAGHPQDRRHLQPAASRLDRYSRMVPLAEIADPKNDYNLNIPRYIDSSEPEDLQDLTAHLHGGIPDRDLDLLSPYWEAFPQLRSQLFKPNRPGYSDLTLDVGQVQQAILDSSEFQKFASATRSLTAEWFAAHRVTLAGINADTRPDDLIGAISDDLLARFKPVALLDEYDVYEQLMEYWQRRHARRRVPRHERRLAGSGQAAQGHRGQGPQAHRDTRPRDWLRPQRCKYKMDLIPPALIVARYFAE